MIKKVVLCALAGVVLTVFRVWGEIDIAPLSIKFSKLKFQNLNRYRNSTYYRGVAPGLSTLSLRYDLSLGEKNVVLSGEEIEGQVEGKESRDWKIVLTPRVSYTLGGNNHGGGERGKDILKLDQFYWSYLFLGNNHITAGRQEVTFGRSGFINGSEFEWDHYTPLDHIGIGYNGDIYKGDFFIVVEEDKDILFRDSPEVFSFIFYNQWTTFFLKEIDAYSMYRRNSKVSSDSVYFKDNTNDAIYLGGRIAHKIGNVAFDLEGVYEIVYTFLKKSFNDGYQFSGSVDWVWGASQSGLEFYMVSDRYVNYYGSHRIIGSMLPLFDHTNITSIGIKEDLSLSDTFLLSFNYHLFYRTNKIQSLYHANGAVFGEANPYHTKYIGSEYAVEQKLLLGIGSHVNITFSEGVFVPLRV